MDLNQYVAYTKGTSVHAIGVPLSFSSWLNLMDRLLYQLPALRVFFGAGEGKELSLFIRGAIPFLFFAECFGCFPSHKGTLAAKGWCCRDKPAVSG